MAAGRGEARPPLDVETALHALKSGDLQSGARLLREAVGTAAKELSLETFANFEESLFRRIFAMVHSPELHERRGAVAGTLSRLAAIAGSCRSQF